jgi:hypothetical protein
MGARRAINFLLEKLRVLSNLDARVPGGSESSMCLQVFVNGIDRR